MGNSIEKSQRTHLTGFNENSALSKLVTSQTKCSLQEGVRMMVTPSMFMTGPATSTATSNMISIQERAILNPPVSIQKAIVVTQSTDGGALSISSKSVKTLGSMATSINTTAAIKKTDDSSSNSILGLNNTFGCKSNG